MPAALLRARETLLAKLDAAEAPATKEKPGVTFAQAELAFRSALGARLVTPPNPPHSYYAVNQRKLTLLGITDEQCKQIAAEAGSQWTGRIKMESIINQAASLMADFEANGKRDPGEPDSWDLEEL
jgi:hypothetical protein